MSSAPDKPLASNPLVGPSEAPISHTRDIDLTDALRDYPAARLAGVHQIFREPNPRGVVTRDTSKAAAVRLTRLCRAFARIVDERRVELGRRRQAQAPGKYPSPRAEEWMVRTMSVRVQFAWTDPDGVPQAREVIVDGG